MQNVDYSKAVSRDTHKVIPHKEAKSRMIAAESTRTIREHSGSFMNMIQQEGNSLSFLYLFVGAILFFTSGLVVGMKIDQKENYFSHNEVNSFANPSETASEQEYNEPTTAKRSREELKTPGHAPKGLKFPPLENHTNYIIRIGSFSLKDANKWGRFLIKNNQDFQGRLFRTSTGKLYLGYYYDKQSVKQALRYVKKVNGGRFAKAKAKRIKF